MILRSLRNENNLIWEALVVSLAAHILFSYVGKISFPIHEKRTVEIDITNMGHLGMPGNAPKPAVAPSAPKPAAPAKQWLQPAPNQIVEPASVPTQPVAATPEEPPPAPTEYGIGTGDGSANVLTRLPQLLNLSDLNAILQRFYPEQARTDRRQGTVVLDIHIDTDGHVQAVDIVQSAGSDFDDAARRAVKLLRFSPAFLGSQRVAVKMRQAIQFKLEE